MLIFKNTYSYHLFMVWLKRVRKVGKRAVSPVIATVLLISLSLVLASYLFIWARSFIVEKIEVNGQPVEVACKEVMYEVEGIYNSQNKNVSLQIVNRGNVDISWFDIRFIKEGDKFIERYNLSAVVGDSSEIIIISVMEGVTDLVMYPVIEGHILNKKITKPIRCEYSGKSLRLESISRNV